MKILIYKGRIQFDLGSICHRLWKPEAPKRALLDVSVPKKKEKMARPAMDAVRPKVTWRELLESILLSFKRFF